MKRSRQELEIIKNFIDSAYSRWGSSLFVDLNKPFGPNAPSLGYSFKFTTTDSSGREITAYNVVCAPIGVPNTDFRIMMHEYGHIYFGHLDGLHEELDVKICNVFRDYRGELIDMINKNCGIDFADKLIERVIDDPRLNHALHNIAMDMEVNTKILSTEDVEEMEKDVESKLLELFEKAMQKQLQGLPEEIRQKIIMQEIEKAKQQELIKFMLPCRYHISTTEEPFPDELSYPEYLMLIIKNLDQFVKMLVSIQKGGNGDTSNISSEDVRNALEQMGNGDAAQGLDQLMQNMGMSASGQGNQNGQGQDGNSGNSPAGGQGGDKSNVGGSKGNGETKEGRKNRYGNGGGNGNNGNDNGTGGNDQNQGSGSGAGGNGQDQDGNGGDSERFQDHRTDERDRTDQKRELGQIKAGGGTGCSSSGTAFGVRDVNKHVDPVDEAIDEVIKNFKNRVVKRDFVRDPMKNYNRGILRSVIAPAITSKVTFAYEPKIVYLIDISGSMDTELVDRVLKTIAMKMRKCGTGRGLKYDIITWNTSLEDHIRDVDPKKSIPRIHVGGGTSIAKGIKYFRENYDPSAILVIISDFEDYLDEWHQEERTMSQYSIYGFNYGRSNYDQEFKNLKVRNFNNSRSDW